MGEKVAETKQKTVAELREFYAQHEGKQALFAATKNAINLADLSKTESRTFSVFSKERLRGYMKNPKANEQNLRNLSRFLYRVSNPYRRILTYNAGMLELVPTVIPMIDITQDNDPEKIKKTYYDTLIELQKMDINNEIYKCALTAWREDCFYGYIYEDDTGFMIYPLDGDYCRVSSTNYDGSLNFAYDFSWFRSHEAYLEWFDKEFTTKYNAYQSDQTLRWQELDMSRTICLKINIDDYTMVLPPLLALFESIIDLIDLQAIQNTKDELSIYKLLVAELETLASATDPDEFSVDIDTAIAYYNKLSASLPPSVSATISPLKITPIEFKGNTTEDVDMISSSMSNLLKLAGGSQILDNDKSNTTIIEAQIKYDTNAATAVLRPQVEKFVNRYLSYVIGDDHAKVRYMDVSPYTKASKKKELIESGQNGIPVRLAIAALDGYDPLETLSMNYLETEVFQLQNSFIPLQTSYTASGSPSDAADPIDGGAPTKDGDELSDSGSETREKGKNDM